MATEPFGRVRDRVCCNYAGRERAEAACRLLLAGKQLLYEHLLHGRNRVYHALCWNILWSRQALLLIGIATSCCLQANNLCMNTCCMVAAESIMHSAGTFCGQGKALLLIGKATSLLHQKASNLLNACMLQHGEPIAIGAAGDAHDRLASNELDADGSLTTHCSVLNACNGYYHNHYTFQHMC